MDRHAIPAACTLDAHAAHSQIEEWTTLLASAITLERTAHGVSITFPISQADTVEDLARREAACCTFLSIATQRSGEVMNLTVAASDDAGRSLVAAFVSRT